MIVTVFGDIDPEKALALVKKLFGGLKPAADFRPLSFQRRNAIGKTIVRHKTIGQADGHGAAAAIRRRAFSRRKTMRR